jgi:hypothetical protein
MGKKKLNNDLSVKIGTENEVFWTKVLEDTKLTVSEHEKTLKFLKATLEMAEDKLEQEKAKA